MVEREKVFRAILESLSICCEECRWDEDGAVYQEAEAATDAVMKLLEQDAI